MTPSVQFKNAPLTIKWVGCDPANFRAGRAVYKPLAIVVHVMDGFLAGTDALFRTPPSKRKGMEGFASSAHYGISKTGVYHQYVKDEDTAYHAGRVFCSTWNMIHERAGVNPNFWSIGIEHEGFATEDWPDAMMQASATLIAALCKKHNIPVDRDHIVGHHEIYQRKVCPGKCDLDKLVSMAEELFKEA